MAKYCQMFANQRPLSTEVKQLDYTSAEIKDAIMTVIVGWLLIITNHIRPIGNSSTY